MMMRVLYILPLLCLLTACAGPPAAVVPTATPSPAATATARPSPTPSPAATATARPSPTARPSLTPAASATPAPSATPATSAQDDTGGTIADAIGRTAAADSYRLVLALEGSGGAAGTDPGNILTLDGEFAGADHSFTASGFLATFLGADPARGLQALRAGGTSYVRGPLSFLGAPDEVWYRLTPEQAALANPPVSASATLGLLTDADFSAFTPGPAVQREDQDCTLYSGNKTATVGLLQSLAQSGLPTPSDPNSIDQAISTVLVCEDGYVHALTLAFSGENPTDPPTPFSYDLDVQLSDFEEPIAITAPADAVDLPTGPIAPTTGPTP